MGSIQFAPPQTWMLSRLDECCRPRLNVGEEGSTPYLEIGDIDISTKTYSLSNKPAVKGALVAKKGDILISRVRPTRGAIVLLRETQIHVSSALSVLTPESGILSAYVHFYLAWNPDFRRYLGERCTGTMYPTVSKDVVREYPIPVAPTSEQCRIVEEVEKQFTRLNAAVAALKRIQANLRRYRASVLKAACEGRLVPAEAELARAEGREYEPADRLLARILKERGGKWEADKLGNMSALGTPRKSDGGKAGYPEPTSTDGLELPSLPLGWVWTTLDRVILTGPQNGLYKPASAYGEGVSIVRIDDFQDAWNRPRKELRRLKLTAQEEALYGLHPDDILINRVNSAPQLGKCLVVPEQLCPAVYESNMMRLKLANGIRPSWLSCYVQTVDGRARLTANAKWAVNQASINQADVRATPLPLPPTNEQDRILDEVDRRLSVVTELDSLVSTIAKRGGRLRHAILRRAFEGKLVPQDPNDEPASSLLERIRAERERAGVGDGTSKPRALRRRGMAAEPLVRG